MNGKTAQKQVDGKGNGIKITTQPSQKQMKANWFMAGLATGGAVAIITTLVALGANTPAKFQSSWNKGKDTIEETVSASETFGKYSTETRLKEAYARLERIGEEHTETKEKLDVRIKELRKEAKTAWNEGLEGEGETSRTAFNRSERLETQLKKLEAKKQGAFDSWNRESDQILRHMDRLNLIARME